MDAVHILRKKKIAVSAEYSIQMPDTWTPIFDLSNADKLKACITQADGELCQVIDDIKNMTTGNQMHRSVPYPVRYISDAVFISKDEFNAEKSKLFEPLEDQTFTDSQLLTSNDGGYLLHLTDSQESDISYEITDTFLGLKGSEATRVKAHY